MEAMDQGYLAQDYYRKAGVMVKLEGKDEATHHFGNYSWTEHMGRKWGQWLTDPQAVLDQLRACGFDLTGEAKRAPGEEQPRSQCLSLDQRPASGRGHADRGGPVAFIRPMSARNSAEQLSREPRRPSCAPPCGDQPGEVR